MLSYCYAIYVVRVAAMVGRSPLNPRLGRGYRFGQGLMIGPDRVQTATRQLPAETGSWPVRPIRPVSGSASAPRRLTAVAGGGAPFAARGDRGQAAEPPTCISGSASAPRRLTAVAGGGAPFAARGDPGQAAEPPPCISGWGHQRRPRGRP